MIRSEEKPHKGKSSCFCCVPCLCACCALQTILCAILIVTLVLLGNAVITRHQTRNAPHLIKSQRTYKYLRLQNDTKPIHYDLTLVPDLQKGSFYGVVNITLKTDVLKKVIVLNSQNLTIRSAGLIDDVNKSVIRVENVKNLVEEEVVLLNLTRKITPGIYHLSINYTGNMLHKLSGLYLSRYKNGENLTRTIATSKFEPTYARQAFPCFDEPNMKATYTVHLWKPSDLDYIALSNYPQVGAEEDYEGGKLVHFQETVSMSTYLACFLVSDFTYTETFFDNNGTQIPFRVYATPEQLEKTKYAGTVGKKAIEYYINYFDIPYPLPKLDMVAIPDFSSGAMEHWGLVTYRETALLYTPETHSAENKQRVLVVVAHELAHSWFGNLVTMDWWDNLWLNEGFASYIEYKGGDAAEPSFGLMEQFLVSEVHPVLTLDAKLSSHPIIQEVGTPDQITEVFDTISYNKGACVLRMLEHAVGENNFKKGVTNYLNKHKYGNAVTKDLWYEIQNVVGSSINVTDFMDSFTIQMGYPILEVGVEGDMYTLKQKRFLTNPDDVEKQTPSPLEYKWTIPVTYITDKGKSKEVIWFNRTKDNIVIEKPKDAKWLKFNAHQAGYYRVNYPDNLWRELGSIMFELPVSDRTHLLEEAFSIAMSGQISYNIPLDLTKYLKNENNYAPWEVASTDLVNIFKLLRSTQYEQQYKNYVISMLTPVYNNLSWDIGENDSHLTKLTRVAVLKLACTMGYDVALKDASTQLDNWFANGTASPDLRKIIYRFGMKTANHEKWEKMFKIFKEETDANEKLKLLGGLTAVSDPSLLSRMIEFSKDETYIRKQDYFHFIVMVAGNPIGLPLVWDYVRLRSQYFLGHNIYEGMILNSETDLLEGNIIEDLHFFLATAKKTVKENWEALVERFTLNDRYLGEIIPGITTSFSTKIKLSEMENFFQAYPEAGAGTAARQRALENVRNNIVWLSKYKETVDKWILANSS